MYYSLSHICFWQSKNKKQNKKMKIFHHRITLQLNLILLLNHSEFLNGINNFSGLQELIFNFSIKINDKQNKFRNFNT